MGFLWASLQAPEPRSSHPPSPAPGAEGRTLAVHLRLHGLGGHQRAAPGGFGQVRPRAERAPRRFELPGRCPKVDVAGGFEGLEIWKLRF